MSRIDNLIADLCPDGVEFKALGQVGAFIRGNGLKKSELTESGVPAIHYGQVHTHYGIWAQRTISFTEPIRAARLRKAQSGDLIIATTSEDDDAVAKAVAWLGDGEVAVSGDAYIYQHSLDPCFVAYFFNSELFQEQKYKFITGAKVRRISGDSLSKIRIPVPPLEVQHEIVRVLDRFTQLEAELEAELEARRRQYEHYRDQLLTFTEGGQLVPMGEVLHMKAGVHIKAADISQEKSPKYIYSCFGGNGIRGYSATFNQDANSLLIGRQGALCGNVQRVQGRFYATEHAIVATGKSNIDMSWAFHKLTHMDLNQYKTKSAQPGLAVGRLKEIPMMLPSIEVQRETAIILDKFDALVNDLSIGLPAELSARRKQYEYYRDKLLTFKEKKS